MIVGRPLEKILVKLNHQKGVGTVEATEKQLGRSLGELLRHYRELCNVTQEFVASQLNVSRQSVSKWELGLAIPSTSNLFALAKLYNIPIEVLLDARRYSEEMAAENDADIELNYDEGEGGENEDADADKSNKMSRKTKRVLALCAIITALAFLVSTVVSINIHNRNYYSNILNISEEQLNKFIESEPDVYKISEQQISKSTDDFYHNVNVLMANFVREEFYQVSYGDKQGIYHIIKCDFSSNKKAEEFFLALTAGRQNMVVRAPLILCKSQFAEFPLIEEKIEDSFVRVWYSDYTLTMVISEDCEKGKLMMDRLADYF